ncbi:MAG: filamentous hemagglutinin N-terminal domain-containing protein [Rhizonema sp. PD37]|nr:filamentous hemagglutinin N-terminal domain-containing protein [Rhizonema sp. PD37]
MTQRHWFAWCLQLGWVGLLGWIGAIACATSTLAQSRIVPDNTLGAESSIVIPNVQGLPIEAITGGAIRGANLFHSFREFNVDARRGAYFQNPSANIKNIFTRVTGNNRSDIFGTLGTISNPANLFLINPNGIVFGPNAALNVGGSFVGTTANAIQFGNLGIFSASNPDIPSPLLTINPSALLFNQLSPASITYNAGLNPASAVTGLRVPDGQSLLLVGGDVNVNGGSLRAAQGRIELAGLAAPGTVGLNLADNTLSLNMPVGVARANVLLNNGAEVNVRGANGGSIVINAHDFNLAGASVLRAGIASGLGTLNSQAGDVEINATGETSLNDGSLIANVVQSQAIGKGGNINITTGSLSLRNSPNLNTSTYGQGNGGNIIINARDRIDFDGGAIANVELGAVGKAGDIRIATGTLSLTNGASLFSNTSGKGDAGNITVDARDTVSFDGGSLASSRVLTNAVGKGGNIHLTTGTLSLKNGSLLTTNVVGQGDAGNISIDARDTVNFDSGASNKFTGVESSIFTGGMGKGGDIQVTTGSLSLTNRSLLFASNSGRGNAGNITINARDTITFDGTISLGTQVGPLGIGNGGDIRVNARTLFLKKNSQLSASNLGQGNAGNIIINASDTVAFDGVNSNGFGSTAYTLGNSGNGGDIQLTTGTLSLTNGGRLFSSAVGNAGNITINAHDTISIDGVGSNGASSGVSSFLPEGTTGKGGDIFVTTGSLKLSNGAQLLSSTNGQGNAGNISVKVDDAVSLTNSSQIRTSVESGGVGKAGDIDILARSLLVTDGSQIQSVLFRAARNLPAAQGRGGNIRVTTTDSVTLSGIGSTGFSSGLLTLADTETLGPAGNITVNTNQINVSDGAIVTASTSSFGNGGKITINANTFEALNGGQVTTSTAGSGKAGTINLNLKDSLTLAGSNVNFTPQRFSGIFANTDPDSTGDGGSIFIDPRQATIRDRARISVSSAGTGNAGNINLFAGTLTLDNGGLIFAQTASTQGGNINLPLGNILLLRRGSSISTTAGTNQAGGNGGNININTPFIVAVPDENSDITANAYSGNGGQVQINAQGVIGIQNRSQPTPESDITASSTLGVQGVVNIFIPDPNILRDNLTQLPENIIDANTLVANSCIARRHNQSGGTFFVIGNGGLPERPGEATLSRYSTGTIRTIPNEGEKATLPSSTNSVRPWKNGDPIIAAQGIYRLANGELVLGRECPLADSY